MSTPKSHVLAAFQAAGINTAHAVWITTCACLIGGRYVAYYGAHGGWQIGRDRTPATRTTVTQDQAVAWANDGVWSDGTACLNGFKVVDGVEKGRKAEQSAPVQTEITALQQGTAAIDPALIAQIVAAVLAAQKQG
jgi:hypothetical protein